MNPMTVGTSWYSKALRAAFGLQGLEAGHEIAAAIVPTYDLSPGAIPFNLNLHVAGATTAVGNVQRPTAYMGFDALVTVGVRTYGGYTIPAKTPFRFVFSPSVNGGALVAGDFVQVAGTNFVLRTGLDYARDVFDSGWLVHDIDLTIIISSLCGAGWQGWLLHSIYLLPTQS